MRTGWTVREDFLEEGVHKRSLESLVDIRKVNSEVGWREWKVVEAEKTAREKAWKHGIM